MGSAQTRPLAVVTGASSGIGRGLRLISLNITGAVHLVKRVLAGMIEAGRGGVLFTSSVAATAPGPYHATYAASKAFLLSFSEAPGYELRDTGVTVTALMPGLTDTEFFGRPGLQGGAIKVVLQPQ